MFVRFLTINRLARHSHALIIGIRNFEQTGHLQQCRPCQALVEHTSFFSPKRVFLFRFLSCPFFSASTTTARSQSFDRLQSDPNISSIRISTKITRSNSPYRERNAQSSRRRSISRHARFRAVPRTNRTLTTANTRSHSATSSRTASPGACNDGASPDEYVPPLGPPPPKRSAATSCLAC